MLLPFFCFYGGKWRVAPKYPKPKYNSIVEPFCGGAGYSLRYHQLYITLYEADPVIYSLWDFLIKSSPQDVLSLPSKVECTDELNISQEAKSLIGFWLNKATTEPARVPSSWAKSGIRPNSHWGDAIKNRIASQVDKIKHWKIFNQSYEFATGDEATWFVDPPYCGKVGRHYKYNKIDYNHLGKWCKSRKGQVIVCENNGAEWLPFQPFIKSKAMGGSRGKKYSLEAIWTNSSEEMNQLSIQENEQI